MKKIIAGFVMGAMLFGTLGVYAAGGNMIEVFYNVKDIKINNVSQTPESKPFLYEGTTYVPLRYVAEKLGQPVKWDGSTQTIYIGETGEETAVYIGNGIRDMNIQSGYGSHKIEYHYETGGKIAKDNLGNEYDKFMTSYINTRYSNHDQRWNYIEFPLNSLYKSFKADVALTDAFKSTTSTIGLKIYADENEIYHETFKAGDMPSEIDVDVTGAVKVKFYFFIEEYGTNAEIGLFNPRFIK